MVNLNYSSPKSSDLAAHTANNIHFFAYNLPKKQAFRLFLGIDDDFIFQNIQFYECEYNSIFSRMQGENVTVSKMVKNGFMKVFGRSARVNRKCQQKTPSASPFLPFIRPLFCRH